MEKSDENGWNSDSGGLCVGEYLRSVSIFSGGNVLGACGSCCVPGAPDEDEAAAEKVFRGRTTAARDNLRVTSESARKEDEVTMADTISRLRNEEKTKTSQEGAPCQIKLEGRGTMYVFVHHGRRFCALRLTSLSFRSDSRQTLDSEASFGSSTNREVQKSLDAKRR
jgi:hypothetical protein